MIVLQSTATGMAERPIGNPKSATGMSSPRGETRAVWETARGICPAKAGRRSRSDRANGRERAHTGEGELYTDSVGRMTHAFTCSAIFQSSLSSISAVPKGRLNFSLFSPFSSLPSILPCPDILISAHPQFSRLKAVQPCQALPGPVKRFSRKKIKYEKLSVGHSASVPFVPLQRCTLA